MQHIAGLGTFNQLREYETVVIRRELTLLRFGMVLVFRSQVRETHSSPVGFCQAKVLRCGVARFFFRVFLISIIGRQGRALLKSNISFGPAFEHIGKSRKGGVRSEEHTSE